MTYKLQAQAGSRRRSCGVTPRTISGMPSSTERDEWGACTFFGGVPPRSPYGVQGAARCELIPRLHLAAVIEGHAGDIPGCSDLSRSSIFDFQRGNPRCAWTQGALEVNQPAVRREYPDDVGACQQWHSAGADRQGTLTIIGSNVRLGTEMPVALSLFP